MSGFTHTAPECISIEASGDLSTKQYLFVDVNSDGQVAVEKSAGAAVVGVLQDKPSAQGRPACVMLSGVSQVVAGAAFAAGARVTVDTAGKAQEATSGQYIHGTALKAATAADDRVAILLQLNSGQVA